MTTTIQLHRTTRASLYRSEEKKRDLHMPDGTIAETVERVPLQIEVGCPTCEDAATIVTMEPCLSCRGSTKWREMKS